MTTAATSASSVLLTPAWDVGRRHDGRSEVEQQWWTQGQQQPAQARAQETGNIGGLEANSNRLRRGLERRATLAGSRPTATGPGAGSGDGQQCRA